MGIQWNLMNMGLSLFVIKSGDIIQSLMGYAWGYIYIYYYTYIYIYIHMYIYRIIRVYRVPIIYLWRVIILNM